MLNSRSNNYSSPQPDSPQIRQINSPTFPNSTLVDSIVNNSIAGLNSQTNSRNPNARYDIRPQQQFCRFAQIQNNKINLFDQGLQVLDQYDYVSILALEGDFRKLPPLINSATGEQLKSIDNNIWISKNPTFSFNLKKYIILLRILVKDELSLGLAHSFCCLISNMVVVGNYSKMNLKYLTQPLRFTINNSQDQKGDVRNRFSLLCGLNQDQGDPFTRQLERQGGLQKELKNMHRFIGNLQSSSTDKFQNILNNIQSYLVEEDKNDIIIHGQIVQEYAEILSKQYNRQGVFRPNQAQNEIEVQQGFQQYLSTLNEYNSKCKNSIVSQSNPDISNQLQKIRIETEQQNIFRSNPYYSSKLSKHMDRKQREIHQVNEQFNDVYNLNILQEEGEKSLKLAVSNKNLSKTELTTELDRLTKRYNQRSRGTNRQKLLTQFLQVFVPTYYKEAGIFEKSENKISDLENQNKKLEQQLAAFQKKKSKGCCQIM